MVGMNYKRLVKRVLRILPDPLYLRLRYLIAFRKPLHLKNPRTFNEKLQWLKLYDRHPEYTRMVDKYEAKKYVAERIGGEYIIPTLGVWDRFEDIDFDALPDQFVLKCTHDSGGVVICKDKDTLDVDAARKKINARMKENYFWNYREWPYKNVKPRIIAEPYLRDDETGELRDYKFYTFCGEVKALLIIAGRDTPEASGDYFDVNFRHLDMQWGYKNAKILPAPPKSMEEMIRLAQHLSKSIPELRVDFYEINGRPFFGEMTFFDGGGLERIEPEKWDRVFGDWVTLPPKREEGAHC